MKQGKLIRRAVSVALAGCMMFTLSAPALAASTDDLLQQSTAAKSAVSVLDAENGDTVDYGITITIYGKGTENDVLILSTSLYSATEKSTSCRSPCIDFLPPFRRRFPALPLGGSSPGIPCRRSCGFQGATGKTATKKPSQKQTSPAFAFSGRSC